jgi:membrane-bound lytic murein transglycosylase B
LIPAVPLLAAIALVVAISSVQDSASTAGAAGRPTGRAPAEIGSGVVDAAIEQYVEPGLLEAVTVGPEDVAEPVRMVLTSARVITALDESGIPELALRAYRQAANVSADTDAACGLRWQLLAAIGRVESNHGRFGGSRLLTNGYGTRPIRGIPLDGRPNVALIRDTDGGRLDGDMFFDRAVGPMQFIPSTWANVAVDANGDAKRDPDNIFDAALGAARYLCAAGGDLAEPDQAAAAVRRYNHADEYVRVVLALAASYERGEADAVSTALSLPPEGSAPAVSGVSPETRSDDGSHSPPASDAPRPARPTRAPAPVSASPRESAPAIQPTQDPDLSEPDLSEPDLSDPGLSDPDLSDPELSDPDLPDPDLPDPEPSDPSTAEPSDPSTPEPSTLEPSTPESSTSQPEQPASGPSKAPEQTPVPEPSAASESPAPSSSSERSDEPEPSESPASVDDAAIGWAPAMREVVVGLLAKPPMDTNAPDASATTSPETDEVEEQEVEQPPGR